MKSGYMLSAAAAVALCFTASGASAECSAENLKDCKGAPWVDGNVMETPLGSKWWPHPIWGASPLPRPPRLVWVRWSWELDRL